MRQIGRGSLKARKVLAVDIGGTTVRMALSVARGQIWEPVAEYRGESEGWGRLLEQLEAFLRPHQKVFSDRDAVAAIALAGPNDRNAVALNVTDWGIESAPRTRALLASHGFTQVVVLNDLEAACMGALHPSNEPCTFFQGDRKPIRRKDFVQVMPGTGLGVGIWRAGKTIPSEGGNLACAWDLSDSAELSIARAISREWAGYLGTYTCILSGRGLEELVSVISGEKMRAVDITSAMKQGRYKEELGVFMRLLGRLSQSIALTILPQLCLWSGSILADMPLDGFEHAVKSFNSHRVHSSLLARMSLALVPRGDLPLRGCLEIARRERRVLDL